MLIGCGVVLGALALMIGLWWLLATYVLSTGDDGPTVGLLVTHVEWPGQE